jgi:hypothetical protein
MEAQIMNFAHSTSRAKFKPRSSKFSALLSLLTWKATQRALRANSHTPPKNQNRKTSDMKNTKPIMLVNVWEMAKTYPERFEVLSPSALRSPDILRKLRVGDIVKVAAHPQSTCFLVEIVSRKDKDIFVGRVTWNPPAFSGIKFDDLIELHSCNIYDAQLK